MNWQRLQQAFDFACELHQHQTRKGTEIPYLGHLLGVASLVIDHGGREDEVIAALLHDAVEDQGGVKTLAEIQRRFGNRVSSIVDSCSDSYSIFKPTWRRRKKDYIAHVAEAGEGARLVSAADKLHNARALLSDYRQNGERLWERFGGGKKGTLWYYRELTRVFLRTGPKGLALELDRVVTELEELAGE